MWKFFKKQIAVPQDHGSWVFILSPLLVGIFAGGQIHRGTIALIVAVMSAFMLRQPMTVLVKVFSGRRPRTDLGPARFWALIYGLIAALALAALILMGFGYVLYLAIPGIPVFCWHLWLVSKREERKQAGIEILATGVLSLAAPAAFWVGRQNYSPSGWWLWILSWLQISASIIHAYLRLEQREWKSIPDRSDRFKAGGRAFLYTSFNLVVTLILGPGAGFLPEWIFIPFLLQWMETLWGIEHPAIGEKPTRIGIRQFLISSFWTILFIIFWKH